METYLKTIRKFLSEYIRHERTYSLILRVMVYFFQLQGDPFFPVITSSGGSKDSRPQKTQLQRAVKNDDESALVDSARGLVGILESGISSAVYRLVILIF